MTIKADDGAIIEKRDALLIQREALISQLEDIADKFEEHEKNANIAKITAASVGLASGLFTVGTIVAAPFTLGTSLALTPVGLGVGAVSAATGVGTTVTHLIIIKRLCSDVKALLKLNEEATKELEYEINKQLTKGSVQFGNTTLGAFGAGCNAYEVVSSGVLKNITFSATRSAVNISKISFVVAAGTGILSSVASLVEIIFISIDINKGSISAHARQLRSRINQLKENTNDLRATR